MEAVNTEHTWHNQRLDKTNIHLFLLFVVSLSILLLYLLFKFCNFATFHYYQISHMKYVRRYGHFESQQTYISSCDTLWHLYITTFLLNHSFVENIRWDTRHHEKENIIVPMENNWIWVARIHLFFNVPGYIRWQNQKCWKWLLTLKTEAFNLFQC